MRAMGIDIGSRFIKAALLENGELAATRMADTSFDPLERCKGLLEEVAADKVVATGYGRHLLEIHTSIQTITEIKAFARGARALLPSCRTIIDIGGQDTKVISLNEVGSVKKFEMNDRCAAGTGKFLEIMARALGYALEEFGFISSEGRSELQINSMCTVFAESEVISLITKGAKREDIAVAVHRSVANRVISMARRVSMDEDITFAGGCAKNSLLKSLIEAGMGKRIMVAEKPEIAGALGAALYAQEG